MTIVEQISGDMTASMRAGTAELTGVLRLLMTSMKNEQIKLGQELTDEQALRVLSRESKQRRDSVTAYDSAGRSDLSQVEQAEVAIIDTYLPKQLSQAEVEAVVDEVLTETGATSKAQMGAVMAAVMKRTAGAADGGMVSRLVAGKLS
jgi:uncharacterized protein